MALRAPVHPEDSVRGGANAYNPGRAVFIPPPPEYVAGLMDDLCVFMHRSDLSPVVQAAVAHAQFEATPEGDAEPARPAPRPRPKR